MHELVRELALALRERVRPLLGAGPEHQTSFVASANAALHEAILEEVSDGIMRLRADRE